MPNMDLNVSTENGGHLTIILSIGIELINQAITLIEYEQKAPTVIVAGRTGNYMTVCCLIFVNLACVYNLFSLQNFIGGVANGGKTYTYWSSSQRYQERQNWLRI